jgi:hypothetical protein
MSVGQQPNPRPQDQLTTQFTQNANSALVSIHKTKQNIAMVVTKNLPTFYYDPNLAANAYEQVRAADLSATSNGDRQTSTLLASYFAKVRGWAQKYKADRESMNATTTVGEDFLDNDPDWQAIETCEKALNALLVSRAYSDVSSCR